MRLSVLSSAIVVGLLVAGPVRADEPTPSPSSSDHVLLSAPVAPTDLQASVGSPFEVQLTWKSPSENAAGFEIQQQCADGRFIRVSIRNADDLVFAHHARSPVTEYVYRVRAFNAAGFSAASSLVRAHTPPLAAPAAEESFTPPPCVSFDAVSEGQQVWRVTLTRGAIDLVEVEGSRRSDTASWTAYGNASGCYRPLGTLEMRWPEYDLLGAIEPAPVASPVLVVQTGHTELLRGDVIGLFRAANGHFDKADEDLQCEGAWTNPPDPDRLPPIVEHFPNCQYPDSCTGVRRY